MVIKCLKKFVHNIPFSLSVVFTGGILIAIISNYHRILPFAFCLLLISGLYDFHSLSAVRKYFSVYMGSFAAMISLWIMVKFSSIEILGNVNNPTSQSSLFGGFCFAAGFILITYGLVSLACVAVNELDLVNVIKALKRRIGEYTNLKKTALAVLTLYLISFSTIILADVEYIDDMGRKATGNTGWEDFSRYLSNIVSQVISTNSYLADVSPLTQLIAVVVITISSLIVLVVFTDQKRFSFWNIIAVLPLGISPYFLECITYKYDSPYMALSVLGGVFPLLFYEENWKLYVTTAVLSTLMVCTTYQAALGIFPVSVMVLLFLQWKKGRSMRDLFHLMLRSVCGYCIGLFGWWYFLMKPVVSTYTSSDIYSLRELPAGLYSNLKHYLGNVYQDFAPLWLICTVVIFACFIVLETVTAERKKWLTAVYAALTAIVSVCLSFGVYIAMSSPIYECRSMYGFGVCIAIFAVIVTDFGSRVFSQIARVSCLGLSWCFFVFCFVYGNALTEQQRYTEFRIEMVLSALDGLNLLGSENEMTLQISGTIGMSPIIENMPQYQNTVLNRLVRTTFAGDAWIWNQYPFLHYYDLTNYNYVESADVGAEDLTVLYDGYYETIYGDESNILIELKEY